jgi:hypothetical protein
MGGHTRILLKSESGQWPVPLKKKEQEQESLSVFNLPERAAEFLMSSGGIQVSFSPDKRSLGITDLPARKMKSN